MENKFTISRRKVLAGLGTIGIASAGAGLGTTAFFSDEESLEGSLEAGKIDLKLDYRATYVPGDRETPFDNIGMIDGSNGVYVLDQVPDLRVDGEGTAPVSEDEWGRIVMEDYGCDDPVNSAMLVDGETGVMFNLDDVKPKDEGEFTISMHICDNRAYLWVKATKDEDFDNDVVEPEASANDSFVSGADSQVDGREGGELDDYMYVRVFFDANCNNLEDTGGEVDDVLIYEGSLAGFLDTAAEGVPLSDVFEDDIDGTQNETADGITGVGCFDPGVHCVAVYWYLPCFNEQDDQMGFSQLGSTVSGTTLADELDAKGLPYMDFDAINMVQTDSVRWTLQFYAIQCRHNMTNDNPFNMSAPVDNGPEVVQDPQ